jgi:DNA-binding LytR/AlgR family response regulator
VERARRRRALREQAGRAAELEAELAQKDPPQNPDYAREFWISDPKGSVRVPVNRIEWIEAAKDYVLLHTQLRSHMLRATMSALEDRLDPEELARVHRSAFIRPSAVTELKKAGRSAEAVLASGAVVPVSLSYLANLERRLGLS